MYQSVSATLTLTLVNNSGGPVYGPASGSQASFQIFFPSFFTAANIQAATLTGPAGWTCSYDSTLPGFDANYTDSSQLVWANGASLVFTLTNLVSTAQPPVSSSFQFNVDNMTGNIPSQIPGLLSLSTQPQPGNLDLTQVLQASLQSQGTIYVSSSSADALANTLFLEFSNVGVNAIFSGKNPWSTKPSVTVSFVYGSSPGALAYNDKIVVGSAWNIKPNVPASQGNNWHAAGPVAGDIATDPQWVLTPLDLDIIGTGASAAITFSFSDIVSITPVGHTQMTVTFSNFPATDTQVYNEAIYVLDIVKVLPPPTRGLLDFYGSAPILNVTGPNQPLTVDLTWSMLYVDSATLVTSYPGIAPIPFSYPNETGLNYDAASVTIPSVSVSSPIFFTLQGYDGSLKFLNARQYAVWVNSATFIDPRDQQVYPTVLINGLYWMTENLNWSAPGSYPYNNSTAEEQIYGRLYPYAQAAQSFTQPTPPPPPWRLPSAADWNNLINAVGQTPYAALVQGGTTGFNALLGGQCDNNGTYSQLGNWGCYWTSDANSNGATICKFSAASSSVNVLNSLPVDWLASVRYVRNA